MPLQAANIDVAAKTTSEQIHRNKCTIFKREKRLKFSETISIS